MQSIEDYFITNNQTIDVIPQDVQVLKCFNYSNSTITSIDFSNYSFSQLNSIIIGNSSCKMIYTFVIDGLPSLEKVIIGYDSFKIKWNKRNKGLCRINNCPNLRQLDIGRDSFQDFKSFQLFNLNSLQSIEVGHNCFKYADFLLKGE